MVSSFGSGCWSRDIMEKDALLVHFSWNQNLKQQWLIMCEILRLYYYDAGLIDGRWYIWIVFFFCTQQKFATFVMICVEVSTSFNMTIFQFWLDIIRENVCVPLTEFEIKKRSVFVLLNLKPCTQIRKNVFCDRRRVCVENCVMSPELQGCCQSLDRSQKYCAVA